MVATIIPFPTTGQRVTSIPQYRTIQETMEQMANPEQPWCYYDTMPMELLEYAMERNATLPRHATWIPVEFVPTFTTKNRPAYRFSRVRQDFCAERTLPFTFCSHCVIQVIHNDWGEVDHGLAWRLPLASDTCTRCQQPIAGVPNGTTSPTNQGSQ